MPKKAKKAKGGKKGKKGGKKASKKEPTIKAMSEANSLLWQARLEFLENSRTEYRENSRNLADQNFALRAQMEKNEEDTIDVITLLTKKDEEKEQQMEKIQHQMKELRMEHRKESEQIIDEFRQQMLEAEQDRDAKKAEVERLQTELKKLKDFGKKRAQMHKELDEIKETMYGANREHKEVLLRMEQKFFEEKMRLQQEANQKIAELADRAHTEAITNLDETTRSVYKDNIRINEALSFHIEEGEKLKRLNKKLQEENEEFRGEKEVGEQIVQNKIQQSKLQKKMIKELQEKVELLEKSLSHMVKEFEQERMKLEVRARKESEAARVEIEKLQRMAQLKTSEMNKVKKIARSILEERREIERFFLDALEHVKLEVAANRAQYRKDANIAYQQKMVAAHIGRGEYPKIRTFNKSESSTNSVFRDLEAAETLMASGSKVDISDLTWEQKEKVLRNLFAMINGAKDQRRSTAPPALTDGISRSNRFNEQGQEAWPAIDSGQEEDKTFLTQAVITDSINLPEINQPRPSPAGMVS